MDGEFYDGFPMEKALCNNCIYKFTRIVELIDPEDIEDVLEALDIDDGRDVVIERHVCLVNYQDIDSIVIECSHFKEHEEIPFFHNNPF